MAKSLNGKVASKGTDKTLVVAVEFRRRHPLYDKAYLKTKKIAVHDDTNLANIGDSVEIVEGRRVSRHKSWRLVKIVKSAQERAK